MMTFLLSLLAFGTPTVDEIVEKAQKSVQIPLHKSELVLTVQKKRRTKEYELSVYQDRIAGVASAEFHSPARDRGTKFLRRDNSLWMFLPSIEKTKRIAGHMLHQGIMGSDLSYEELLLQQDWQKEYKAEQHEDTVEQGTPCFLVTLHNKKEQAYDAKRVLWIEKEHFVPIKEQVFDSSGNLFKEWNRKDLRVVGAQWVPFYQEIQNKRISTNKTIIKVSVIEVQPELSQDFFSHRWLER